MAGETKLLLSEYFPDEHETILFTMDSKGEYSAKRIKLYELDRQDGFDAATVLYIPKAEFMPIHSDKRLMMAPRPEPTRPATVIRTGILRSMHCN